jgi:hypothetical protein
VTVILPGPIWYYSGAVSLGRTWVRRPERSPFDRGSLIHRQLACPTAAILLDGKVRKP